MGTLAHIPMAQPFLKTLASGLLDQTAHDPTALADIDVLLPTRRAVRVLTDLFLETTEGRPLLLPRLRAIADIDDAALDILVAAETGAALSFPPAMSILEQRLVLSNLIRVRDTDMDFARSLALADGFLDFVQSVQDEGLTLEALDHVVAAEFATHWQITLDFLNILRTVWPEYMATTGQMDDQARRIALFQHLTHMWKNTPPDHPVMVAGVTGSLPYVAEFMAVVADMPTGTVILPGYDPDLPQDHQDKIDPQHPQYTLMQTLARMNKTRADVVVWSGASPESSDTARGFWVRTMMCPGSATENWVHLKSTLSPRAALEIKDDLNNMRVISVDKSLDEARAIAMMVRQEIEVPDREISIITPDRALATAIMGACARFGIDVNDSAGEPLSTCRAGQFISLVLRLAVSGMTPIDILSVLRHPDLNLMGVVDQNIYDFEQIFLRGLRPPTDPELFWQAVCATKDIQEILPLVEQIVKGVQIVQRALQTGGPLHDLARVHLEVCETLAQRDEDNVSVLWREEDGEGLSRLFQDILSLDNPVDLGPGDDYAVLIEHLMSTTRINRRGVGHPRVALLGVYESRLTRADHVILAGFNEGLWPGPMAVDLWLSRGMRRDFGLPPLEQAVGRMAHDLVQLLHAPTVTITYRQKSDDGPALPSRWLLRFDAILSAMFGSHHHRCRTADPVRLASLLDRPDPQQIQPARRRPAPCPPVSDRPQTISATQMETLMTDPYAFYAQKILRLKPLDPLDQEPDDRLRGILLHDILQRIIQDDGRTHLDAVIDDSFQKFYLDQAARTLIEPRLRQILLQTLAHNENWVNENSVRSSAVETTWSMTVPDTTPSITLTARLDRLDRLDHPDHPDHLDRLDRLDQQDDGSFAIIDYKTGANVPSKKAIVSGSACQLVVQTLCVQRGTDPSGAAGKQVVLAALWHLKPDEVKETILTNNADDKITLEKICTDGLAGLARVLNAFADVRTPYYPVPDPRSAPEHGRYDHLSRRQIWWGLDTDPIPVAATRGGES